MSRQAGSHEGAGCETDGLATATAVAEADGRAARVGTALAATGDEGAGTLAAGPEQAAVSRATSGAKSQRDSR
jgi:hypothetical protein